MLKNILYLLVDELFDVIVLIEVEDVNEFIVVLVDWLDKKSDNLVIRFVTEVEIWSKEFFNYKLIKEI